MAAAVATGVAAAATAVAATVPDAAAHPPGGGATAQLAADARRRARRLVDAAALAAHNQLPAMQALGCMDVGVWFGSVREDLLASTLISSTHRLTFFSEHGMEASLSRMLPFPAGIARLRSAAAATGERATGAVQLSQCQGVCTCVEGTRFTGCAAIGEDHTLCQAVGGFLCAVSKSHTCVVVREIVIDLALPGTCRFSSETRPAICTRPPPRPRRISSRDVLPAPTGCASQSVCCCDCGHVWSSAPRPPRPAGKASAAATAAAATGHRRASRPDQLQRKASAATATFVFSILPALPG
mmetsp:Transcript_13530/g.39177  ORF Transcript_13530/g.39177 Transcript_13530/m.39177 type:complete len:298 (-) Transcript_13530:1420-2313(-)